MKKFSVMFLILVSVLLTQGELKAQSVGLRIPDTTAIRGTFMDIPLYVDSSLTGKNVYSYTFRIKYDPYYLQPELVIVDGTIGATFGTPVINMSVTGYISVAAAGTDPLQGSGTLLIIKWKVIGCCWTNLSFDDASHNFFNEGSPEVNFEAGDISIENPPTLNIYPDSEIIAKGEQQQFDVWGGSEPYFWSLTDTTVASIDNSGQLSAIKEGFTRVIATDTYGVTDTTQVIEIRSVRLYIPDDLSEWEGATIDVPVMCSDLTGLDISSGTFKLEYSQLLLHPEGVILENSILEGTNVQYNFSNNKMTVSFAGHNVLSSSGVLMYIRFKVNESYYNGSYLYLSEVLFNENLPGATSDGYFAVKTFPSRYIYPSESNMVVGDTLNLNIYGEYINPLKWSVSDSTLAYIDQLGHVIARKRGNITVTAIDSVGAPAYSNLLLYDTRAYLNDTSICTFEQIVEYPVYLQQLPVFDSVYSVEGTIYFDTTMVSFAGFDIENCVLNGWMSSINYSGTYLKFAFSSSSALKNFGRLFNVKLQPKDGFNSDTWVNVGITNFKLNEGEPSVLASDYYCHISGKNKISGEASIWTESLMAYCENDTVTIYTSLYNIVNPKFEWFKNNILIPNETGSFIRLHDLTSNDTIYCRVINSDLCAMDSVNITNRLFFNINQKPILIPGITGDTIVSFNTSKTYSIQPVSNAEYYIWDVPSGASGSSNENSITLYFENINDTLVLKVYAFNECGMSEMDSIRIIVVNDPNHSILYSAEYGVSIYPNPVFSDLYIKLPASFEYNDLEIIDLTGKKINLTPEFSGSVIHLEINNLPKGIYFVKVKGVTCSGFIRFIKR